MMMFKVDDTINRPPNCQPINNNLCAILYDRKVMMMMMMVISRVTEMMINDDGDDGDGDQHVCGVDDTFDS